MAKVEKDIINSMNSDNVGLNLKGRWVHGKGRVDDDYAVSPHSRAKAAKVRDQFNLEFANARKLGESVFTFTLDGKSYNTRLAGEPEANFESKYITPKGLKSLPYDHLIDPTEGMTGQEIYNARQKAKNMILDSENQKTADKMTEVYQDYYDKEKKKEEEIQRQADSMTESYQGYYQSLRKDAGLD
tara:strand:+ start:1781 stop:2338 length:558 start_codon:yes stop_codon:yes gene_type:complete